MRAALVRAHSNAVASVRLRVLAVDGTHLPGGSEDQRPGDSVGGIAVDLAKGPVVALEGLRTVNGGKSTRRSALLLRHVYAQRGEHCRALGNTALHHSISS